MTCVFTAFYFAVAALIFYYGLRGDTMSRVKDVLERKGVDFESNYFISLCILALLWPPVLLCFSIAVISSRK